MGIEALETRLSGGGTNVDPSLSIGGAMSSVVVLSQVASVSVAIPGVTITDAAGNPVGSGTLRYYFSGKTITWQPPVGNVGLPVSIGANGTYIVRGANALDGYVIIAVISANLSGSTNYATSVTVANKLELMLPSVDKDTAYAGATQYFLYYLNNAGAATLKDVKIQVQIDTPGLDTLSICAITTKNTVEAQGAAAGHSYLATGINSLMGDLLTTDYWGFWIRRVVPVATVDGTMSNTFKIRVTSLT